MIRRSVLLLVALLALAGCGGATDETSAPPVAATSTAISSDEIVDIHNVLDLRAAFEADRGKTRLLMLLSPT